MNNISPLIGIAFLLPSLWEGSGMGLFAQDNLDTISIEVIKEYEPTISDAYKINDNPQIYDTVPFVPKLTYSIKSSKITTVFEVEPIKPATIKGEPLLKLYKNYARIGFGNYRTSFGEFFVNNLRSRKHSVGAHIQHLSSSGKLKDVAYSGYSDNAVNLYGKKFFNKQTLAGDAYISRNVVHYYGFSPDDYTLIPDSLKDKDAIRQRFFYWSAQVRLLSHYSDSAKLNHDIKLKFDHIDDISNIYGLHDHNLVISGLFNKYLQNEFFQVKAMLDYYNNSYTDTSDVLSYTNNTALLNINPTLRTSGNKYTFVINLNAYLESDTEVEEPAHLFPGIDLSYNVIDNFLIPYIGLNSEIRRNSFKGLTDENPFLKSTAPLKNTLHQFRLYGGVKGALSSATTFNASVTYDTKIDRMPFFVNDTSGILSNQFTIEYYDDVKLLDIRAEISHQKTEKFKMLFIFDYSIWTMDKEWQKPWHKPGYELTLSGVYNLKDKIILNADIFVLGKQLAKTYQADTAGTMLVKPKELKGIADINLSLEYRYTKKLSAFLRFNNIGAFRYERWYNYPTQRFNVLGGVTYGF